MIWSHSLWNCQDIKSLAVVLGEKNCQLAIWQFCIDVETANTNNISAFKLLQKFPGHPYQISQGSRFQNTKATLEYFGCNYSICVLRLFGNRLWLSWANDCSGLSCTISLDISSSCISIFEGLSYGLFLSPYRTERVDYRNRNKFCLKMGQFQLQVVWKMDNVQC